MEVVIVNWSFKCLCCTRKDIILTLVKTECRLNADSANVVHMTVRPQDIVDEEDASKGKAMGRDRGDGESNAGCRCVIQ
jgi:hypothetical protein